MKRTGRKLNLCNMINKTEPVNSIFNLGYRLATIFQDDREGYGWKVTKLEYFGFGWRRVTSGFSLMTTQPSAFENAVAFGEWAAGRAEFSNQLIGVVGFDQNTATGFWESIKTDHVAVNHLSLLYEEGTIPYYNIELEEYEISDREEIAFRIKEVSQSVDELIT
tara:strand:+ start:791 stop:1282 length:492 start_codon:yes stop_codon:yes gene_type:complete